MELVLIALCIILGATCVFLGQEMMKKFGFFQAFIKSSNQMITLDYQGDKNPGMHNIMFWAKKPFTVLVGFHLDIPFFGKGFDYYGYAKSNDHGILVVSTYMGRQPVRFMFYANCDQDLNPITVSALDNYSDLKPHITYPPHWWQKLGFWA